MVCFHCGKPLQEYHAGGLIYCGRVYHGVEVKLHISCVKQFEAETDDEKITARIRRDPPQKTGAAD